MLDLTGTTGPENYYERLWSFIPKFIVMLTEIDLESKLRRSLPILFELLGENYTHAQWDTINSNFIKVHNRREAESIKEPGKLFQVNLYSLIIAKEVHRSRTAFVFLDFLQRTLEELCDTLTPANKKELRRTLYQVLINFDHKYRNYFGELLILNNAVKHGAHRLVKIESPITESKTADFLLENEKEGRVLVEVVNIHIDDDRNDVKRFIAGKLEDKFISKAGDQKNSKPFTIVPVIWASHKQLRRLEAMYGSGDGIQVPFSCLPPCAYATFDYDADRFINKFGTITTLFKKFELS